LANRTINGLIFHRKRKKRVYRLFRYWPGDTGRKRSPYRAYFTSGILPLNFGSLDEEK
jgi:hypothetical protein